MLDATVLTRPFPPMLGTAPRQKDTVQPRDVLAATVAAEVIPRLLLAISAQPASLPAGAPAGVPAQAPAAPCERPGAAEVATLVDLVLSRQDVAAAGYVAALQARGLSLESLYLDLLTPTARRLGELWELDACDFTEVTVGMWRLHQALRETGPGFIGSPAARPDGACALLVPLPGEQHTFGLDMLAQFFRRAGWTVHSPSLDSHAALADALRRKEIGVVGFSVACTGHGDAVAAAVRTARRATAGRGVGVMVGGPACAFDPDLAARAGADATAPDAVQAVLAAERLLMRRAGPASRRRGVRR